MLQQNQFNRIAWNVLWAIAILVILIPISSESIWMGESLTLYASGQETLGDALQSMDEVKWTKQYMPGYTTYIWVWERIWGNSEWMARLSNWPCLALLLCSVYFLPVSRWKKITILATYTLHPFIWTHMDEAKPTMMLLCCSGLALHGFLMYFYGKGRIQIIGRYVLGFGVLLGVATHTLFALTGVPLLFLWAWHAIAKKNFAPNRIRDGIIIGGVLLAAGIFWGLGYSQKWSWEWAAIDYSNLIYLVYEFLGCSGLGPSWKSIIRDPHLSLFTAYAKQIYPLLGLWALFGGLILLKIRKWNPFYTAWFWVLVVNLLLILLLMKGFKFQFWGRHLAFIFPFFVLFISDVFEKVLKQYPILTKGLMLGIALLWTFSSLNIRFHPIHQKGDYRKGAEMAKLFSVQYKVPVIWTSDEMTGKYYDLDFPPVENGVSTLSDFPHAIRLDKYYPLMEATMESNQGGVLVWFDRFNNFDRNQALAFTLARRGGVLIHQESSFKIYKLGASRPHSLTEVKPPQPQLSK